MNSSDVPAEYFQKAQIFSDEPVPDELLEKQVSMDYHIPRSVHRKVARRVTDDEEEAEKFVDDLMGSREDEASVNLKLHPDETDIEIYRELISALEPLGIEGIELDQRDCFADHVDATKLDHLKEYAVLDGIIDNTSHFGFQAETDPEVVGTDEAHIKIIGTTSTWLSTEYSPDDSFEPGLSGLQDHYENIDVNSALRLGEPSPESEVYWARSIEPFMMSKIAASNGNTEKSGNHFETYEGLQALGAASNVREYSEILNELQVSPLHLGRDEPSFDVQTYEQAAELIEDNAINHPEIIAETRDGSKVTVKYEVPSFAPSRSPEDLGEYSKSMPERAVVLKEKGVDSLPAVYNQLNS